MTPSTEEIQELLDKLDKPDFNYLKNPVLRAECDLLKSLGYKVSFLRRDAVIVFLKDELAARESRRGKANEQSRQNTGSGEEENQSQEESR